MKISFLDRISAKIELWRLEQRYTKRRHRRSTFVSDAVYVDGEYVYPSSPSSSWAANSPVSALHGEGPPQKRQSSVVNFRTFDEPAASTESVSAHSAPTSATTTTTTTTAAAAAAGRARSDDGRKFTHGPKWNTTRSPEKTRSMVAIREVRWRDLRS